MSKRKRRPNPNRIRAQYVKDAEACIGKDKVQYVSEEDAKSMIFKISRQRPWLDLKCYKCSYCGAWHLAKKPPES